MKKHTILSGKNMLEENVPTCESDESVFARVISKSLHKLDKGDMDKSSSPKRKIPERCVH